VNSSLVESILLSSSVLFIPVDPLALAPAFLPMTQGDSPGIRKFLPGAVLVLGSQWDQLVVAHRAAEALTQITRYTPITLEAIS
jgi:hypothetical protein